MSKLKAAAIIFLLISVVGVLGVAAVGWNAVSPVIDQYFYQVDSADKITKDTSSADYAMRQREWFAQQRQDIKGMRQKIRNQRIQIENFQERHNGSMDDLSYMEQQQYNRMTNRLLGYRNQHETYVRDYNAKMNVSYQEQYSDELPLEMEDKFWNGDLVP